VLWTHDHADQTHGIDDVRPLAIHQGPIDAWASPRTLASLRSRFGYVFAQPDVSVYSTLYRAHEIGEGPFTAAGVRVVPFEMDHGSTVALGFRFGGIAYCNDVVRLDERAFEALEGVDTFIVDAMRYRPHPTHAHLDLTLEWIARIKPRRAVLTNMHVDMDYDEVNRVTPAHVEPAYDGLVLEA
jgi:phosphoribosyl 1,2-cyclic phosphate phosphodiesterase